MLFCPNKTSLLHEKKRHALLVENPLKTEDRNRTITFLGFSSLFMSLTVHSFKKPRRMRTSPKFCVPDYHQSISCDFLKIIATLHDILQITIFSPWKDSNLMLEKHQVTYKLIRSVSSYEKKLKLFVVLIPLLRSLQGKTDIDLKQK